MRISPQPTDPQLFTEWLAESLFSLNNQAVDARNWLVETYGDSISAGDPRKATARHIRTSVTGCAFNAEYLLHRQISSPSWWSREFPDAPKTYITDICDDYVATLAKSLIVFPFSAFESGLRTLVWHWDPTACGGASASADSLVRWALKRTTNDADERAEDERAFALLRTLRNLIHTNGVYRKPEPATFEYRGQSIVFVDGEPPELQSWPLNISLVADLIDANRRLMSSAAVRSLKPIDG